ncbi:MAG: RDD family protein, partial [Pirellulales bacterium]
MSGSVVQIDSTVEIVTPENIAFHYRVAGPFRRLPAYVLDLFLRWAVLFVLAIVCSLAGIVMGGMAIAVIMVAYFLLEWFYGGLFETFMNGQTPGKWVLGVRVLSVDGQPINGVQAVLRNVLRFADMMPLLSLQVVSDVPMYALPTFGLALVTMTMSRRFQRLGDLVCGTIVVMEERSWLTGVARLEDRRTAPLAAYIPMDFRISRSLAQSLAAYVDRRRFFSIPRRREVARHLAEPLLTRFGFPPDTSYDLLLCALYCRAFIADAGDSDHDQSTLGTSP